ncbi:hypothetical protein AgCh_029812 [Apium graveolens]
MAYICPTNMKCRHFLIPKHCVMNNKKTMMIIESELKTKKIKTDGDLEMIIIFARYLRNIDAMLPKKLINEKDDELDDDERKKDEHKSFGSNTSQFRKSSGSQKDENKKGENEDSEKKGGGDANQTSSKKLIKPPSLKPPTKTHFKSTGRKSKKIKVEIGVLWDCFNQEDFLPISEEISDDDYNNRLAEEIVKDAFTKMRKVELARRLRERDERHMQGRRLRKKKMPSKRLKR